MPESKTPPLENESIDSYSARTRDEQSPPRPSARAEQIGHYLRDVDRLQRGAVTAGLLLKQEASEETVAALGAIVAELQDGLADLQRRRSIVMPRVLHRDDQLDAINDLGFDAHEHIYKIEALLDVMTNRLQTQSDGHLVTLCELCSEQMPKLRFALYGKEMGP